MNPRGLEKDHPDFEHVHDRSAKSSDDHVAPDGIRDADHGFTHDEQRKIIRRIDRRLVITVGIMYCVSLMDRTNLSNAAIAGMTEELSLGVQNRYVSASPLLTCQLTRLLRPRACLSCGHYDQSTSRLCRFCVRD